MSIVVPLLAAGGFYLIYNVLRNRSDKEVDQQFAKDECQHKDHEPPPNGFHRYCDLADVVWDKCNYENHNFTVSTDGSVQTADGRTRTDLCTRHAKCPAGLVEE